jgi:hypothetical protein
MQLDGRQRELLCNGRVLDALGLLHVLALDPLGDERGGRDGRAAAERLKLCVDDLSLVIHLDLQLHDVSAGGGAHEAGAHVQLLGVELAHVAGVLVVVDHLKRRKQHVIDVFYD